MNTPFPRAVTALLVLAFTSVAALPAAQAQTPPALWTGSASSWVHDVDVTPWGDVAVLTYTSLALFEGGTGDRLATLKACSGEKGRLHFVAPQRAVLVCEDGMERVDFPDATTTAVLDLKGAGKPSASASNGSVVAIGFPGGAVRMFAADAEDGPWTERGSVQLDSKVTALAVSPDASLVAVGLDSGSLSLWEPGTGKVRTLSTGRSDPAALAFSANGDTLFGATDTFEATFFATRTGKALRKVKIGSWINASAFSGKDVFTSGSDGLVHINGASGKGVRVAGFGAGAGSDPTGQLICGGDTSGSVGCFGVAPAAPGRYAELPRLGPEPVAAAAVSTSPTAPTADPADATAPTGPPPDGSPGPEPTSSALYDTIFTVYSLAALVGGPLGMIAIHDDLSLDEATLISLVALGGSTTLAVGGALVGAGVISIVLAAIFTIFDPAESLTAAGAGTLMIGVGLGLVVLSPIIFGVGVGITDASIGSEPENPITVSVVSTLGGALGVGLGILVTEAFSDSELSTWTRVLAIVSTSTLFASLTYAAIRESSDKTTPAIIIPPLAIPF